MLARFGWAAICGALLGIINMGVAFVAGGSTVVSISPSKSFPIWAVAGAALGRLAYSSTALVAGACVFQASMFAGFLIGNGTGAPGTFAAILLWPPAGSTVFFTKIALHDSQAVATAAFLGGSLSYAVAGYLLTRRRSAALREPTTTRR